MIFSPSGHGLSLPLCIFSDQLQLLVKLTQLHILLSPVGVDGIKSLENFSQCKQLPMSVGNRNKLHYLPSLQLLHEFECHW